MMFEQDIEAMSEEQLRTLLTELTAEHRRMDGAIRALIDTGVTDQLKVARMKKEKLRLKDHIARVEELLTPDIIA